MNTWPTKKLGELLISNDTGIWGDPIHNDEKGILILRSTNFENDGLLNFNDIAKRNIPKGKIENLQLQDGDILLEKSGGGPEQPVGRVTYFVAPDNQIYTFANFIQRLRPKQEVINSRFLFHCLFYLYKIGITLRLQSQTTGIRNLNLNLYLKTKITIPSLHIQHQIVQRLDAIKKAQELNDKQISLADELFQSLLQRELESKEKNWEEKRLGEVCEINPKTSLNFKKNRIKYVEMAAIDESLKEIKYFLERPIDKISSGAPRFKDNDVIFARITPCTENGKIAFVENCNEVYAGSTELHVLRAKQDKLLSRFVFYCLMRPRIKDMAVASMIGTTGRQRVPKEFFNYLKIPLPPLQIQIQIVAKLQAAQDYKKKLLEQKQKLQELFASCLDKAMKGEL